MEQIVKVYTQTNDTLLIATAPVPGVVTISINSQEKMNATLEEWKQSQPADTNFDEVPTPQFPYATVLDSQNNKIVDLMPSQYAEVIHNGVIVNTSKV